MEKYIDLNSDLGEGFGSYRIGNDEDIIKTVSSINIACGWHAGDPLIMDQTIALSKKYGVKVGAHPGYPDLLGFGRRDIKISLKEARAYLLYQLGALDAFARSHDIDIQHVKLHGAFYNMTSKDKDMAKVLIEALRKYNERIFFLCLSGSNFAHVAKEEGAFLAQEVFADRAYNEDGSLVPRSQKGAVIEDEEEAIKRTVKMVQEGLVETITGKAIPIAVDSICVHGDNPKAVQFVKKIRQSLMDEGVLLKAFSENI